MALRTRAFNASGSAVRRAPRTQVGLASRAGAARAIIFVKLIVIASQQCIATC